jgi:type IV secretion system protein VirB9
MIQLTVLGLAAALAFTAGAGDLSIHAAPSGRVPISVGVGKSKPRPSAAVAATRLLAENGKLAAPVARSAAARHRDSTTARAARSAMLEPRSDFYVNAVQVYPWSDGALYRLYAAPERVSEIALQPGEALVSVASGDTARWVIGDTTSGSGADRRIHVLVKPSATGLTTNLVIATDRRLYRIEVASSGGPAMAGIAWTYPDDELIALKRAQAAAAAAQPVAAGLAVEKLNFSYSIAGDKPSWRPVRAFDDGRQVFIQFPASLDQDRAPPLFVLGEDGRAELVNYRLQGRYYVVDRLFAAAELRLGGRRQQVVRIARTGAGAGQRRARP